MCTSSRLWCSLQVKAKKKAKIAPEEIQVEKMEVDVKPKKTKKG